jgi:phospholipid transport system transporter-binding protein
MKLRPRPKLARKATRGRQTRVAAAARGSAVRRKPLVLQHECMLAGATALKKSLCTLSAEKGSVTLDAGAVERIDTAALQLLAAFVRDRRLAGRPLKWRAVSAAMAGAARTLGMSSMLALEEAPR